MLRALKWSCVLFLALEGCQSSDSPKATVWKDVTLIDGSGSAPQAHVSLVIQADTLAAILPSGSNAFPEEAQVMDGRGKTVIPSLVNTHCHVGGLKGTSASAENYTRENVLRQLAKYEAYGVGTVLSLGTDREIIFALRDSSRQGKLPGALLFTAGYGIGVYEGAPPQSSAMNMVLRPRSAEEARQAVQKLVPLKPDIVKIWVDDFLGKSLKMSPEVYQAVIEEAHKNGLRVAAHVYYLEDARRLVDAGVDVLAHSIRDQEVDDALVQAMKTRGVFYMPTLSLDEYNFIYAGKPEWINDDFFKESLEPGVLGTLRSDAYMKRIGNDPDRAKKEAAFQMALRNLKKLHNGGVNIAMGTDSGANMIRVQGFSEHLELELMTQAGLTPLQVLACATSHGAEFLRIANKYGTLQPGKKASFLVLNGDPSSQIKQTRAIASVWKDGKQVK